MNTYVLTANPLAPEGMDRDIYYRVCNEVRRLGRSETKWTVGYMRSPDEPIAQERYGQLTGRVILLRQGGEPQKRGIIAFGKRLAGPITLAQGHEMFRIEAPVQFTRASTLDEEPLITTELLRQRMFPQNPRQNFPFSGLPITDDEELAALESCCVEVCGTSLSDLCSTPEDGTDESRRGAWPTQPDAAHNAEVEASAIECVRAHLGIPSSDRQKDNCGWDLEFLRDGRRLCVEVKGISGTEIHVEVTPNEYQAMQRAMNGSFTDGDYRLAVVSEALSATRKLFLFTHHTEMDWLCELSQRRITVTERIAARLE